MSVTLGRVACARLLGRFVTLPRYASTQAASALSVSTIPRFSTAPIARYGIPQVEKSVPHEPLMWQIQELRAQDILSSSVAQELSQEPVVATGGKVGQEGMIFEVSLWFLFAHYQQILMLLARNMFQTFRPLLLAFVMGQLVKAGFFFMGAPMLISFYSIWMFEMFYGMLQCFISFLFVAMFYNNLCFRGLRPMMSLYRNRAEIMARRALGRFRA